MLHGKKKAVFAAFTGVFGVLMLGAGSVWAHQKEDPAIQPSADWMRQAEVLIGAHVENPGALSFTPLAPEQRHFAFEKKSWGLVSKSKTWTGWVGNIQVQKKESMSAPVVNYTCLLSTGDRPPAKKIFANYLLPVPKEAFYTIASKAWLKQQYENQVCGIDGKKCMFDSDKQAAALKGENLASNPVTLVKGRTIGQPRTYLACAAGSLRS